VVAYTLMSSDTLRDAIVHLQLFLPLVSDGGRVRLSERNGQAWLIYEPQEANLPFSPQQVEAVLACAVSLMRWIAGADLVPSRIFMRHAAISALPVYRELLGCEPEFGRELNGIGLPASRLDSPLPARNPELFQLHESVARRQLSALSRLRSLRRGSPRCCNGSLRSTSLTATRSPHCWACPPARCSSGWRRTHQLRGTAGRRAMPTGDEIYGRTRPQPQPDRDHAAFFRRQRVLSSVQALDRRRAR
jgi:hypothetical protein